MSAKNFSTKNFSTKNFSTKNFSTKNFSTKNFSTKPGLSTKPAVSPRQGLSMKPAVSPRQAVSIKPAVTGSPSKRACTAVTAPEELLSSVPPDQRPPQPGEKSDGEEGGQQLGKKPSHSGRKMEKADKKKITRRKKPSKKRKKKVKRVELAHGDNVRSLNFKWEVKKKLGSGGFGDVYKVVKVDNLDTKEYAMKTEMVAGEKRMLRLKIEVSVLEECQAAEPSRRKHFVEFLDKGMCNDFKFVVMGLVGPSIEDVRIKILGRSFAKETAMNITLQTLKAVTDLHHVGWLHRDIKPQNFAVGLEEVEATVFMLDFGIARMIFNPGTRVVKTARPKVKFLGTIRFASRACHKQLEQGRKDDLETWLYMVADLFDWFHGLSWKRKADKKEVLHLKEKFFASKKNFAPSGSSVPQEMWCIAEYIRGLECADEPDYGFIEKALHAVAADCKIDLKKKAEWIGKKVPKSEMSSSSSGTSTDNQQSGSSSSSSESKKKAKNRKKQKKASERKRRHAKNTKDGTKEGTREMKDTKETKETTKPTGKAAALKSGRSRK